MAFKIYHRGQIPKEEYVEFKACPNKKRALVSGYNNRAVIILDINNDGDAMEGLLEIDKKDYYKYYLVDSGSPESEKRKLVFRYDDLESIFVNRGDLIEA